VRKLAPFERASEVVTHAINGHSYTAYYLLDLHYPTWAAGRHVPVFTKKKKHAVSVFLRVSRRETRESYL
jgi:hypothetical protein